MTTKQSGKKLMRIGVISILFSVLCTIVLCYCVDDASSDVKWILVILAGICCILGMSLLSDGYDRCMEDHH